MLTCASNATSTRSSSEGNASKSMRSCASRSPRRNASIASGMKARNDLDRRPGASSRLVEQDDLLIQAGLHRREHADPPSERNRFIDHRLIDGHDRQRAEPPLHLRNGRSNTPCRLTKPRPHWAFCSSPMTFSIRSSVSGTRPPKRSASESRPSSSTLMMRTSGRRRASTSRIGASAGKTA